MDNSLLNGEKATEAALLESGYRKYSGEDIDIYYSKNICQHVGNCVRGNPEVFEVGRRPWIIPDNGEVEANVAVLNSCPTGALKYIRKD